MIDPTHLPARFHQDGWTPDVRAVFLDTLMTTGSVREAAWTVGKTPASAYRLRAHADGAGFKAEWAAAVASCVERVREIAVDRAFNGRVMPVIKDGVEVGERLVFNDRLLIQLMRLYDAPAYRAERAAAAQALINPPARQLTRAELETEFMAALDKINRDHAIRNTEAAADALADAAAPAARGGGAAAGFEGSPVAGDAGESGVVSGSPKADEGHDDSVAKESRKAFDGQDDSVAKESPKADAARDDSVAKESRKADGARDTGVAGGSPKADEGRDDSVAKESRKADDAHHTAVADASTATQDADDFGEHRWFPHTGGASVVAVSNESPNHDDATARSDWSDAPQLSTQAGSRNSWRQSG